LTLKISGFRLPDHHLKNEDCVPYPLVVPKRELQLAVVVVVAAVVVDCDDPLLPTRTEQQRWLIGQLVEEK
jgi:hypothetical protein